VSVELSNYGKTVALDAADEGFIHITKASEGYIANVDQWVNENWNGKWEPSEVAVIFPEVNVSFGASSNTVGHLSKELEDDLAHKRSVIYMIGRVHYADIFPVKHTTTFCAYYQPDFDQMEFCQGHNHAD